MNYFDIFEFRCPCCGKAEMNECFLDKLDKARERADIPFKINSGYRCRDHNRSVGGKDDSSHIHGFAADIECTNSRNRFKIIESLLDVGIGRIGIAKTFIHADTDGSKDPMVIWLY